jgi:Zn-dependent peptidase ImmA (M78 family)
MVMTSAVLNRPLEALTPGQIIAKHQTQAPVDVVAIAAELGVNVWETKTLPSSISGKIFKDPLNGGFSGFSILVNAGHSLTRKRFTIAHELGHFLLHRERLDNGEMIDDAMYRSGVTAKEETEANRFAAELLMPFALVRSLLAAGISAPEQLAAKLQVSLPAMRIRLGLPLE